MMTDLLYRLRALFRRTRADADLDDELLFHLERQTQANIRAGLDPDEARRRARIDLGGLAQVTDQTRDSWGVRTIEALWQDVQYACRTLRRTPGFTLTALLTLTVGVSFNTSIATMCTTMLYRPWQVAVADELVLVSLRRPDGRGNTDLRDIDYRLLADNARLSIVVATGCGMTGLVEQCRFEIDAGPPVLGHFVSGNYFQALEIPIERGRGLIEADDRHESTAPVVVISHDLWLRQFRGTPDILGRTIALDGVQFSVVGVTAPAFTGTSLLRRDVWVSLATIRLLRPSTRTTLTGLEIAARLRPGATREQVRGEFDALLASIEPRRVSQIQGTSFLSRPNDRREAAVFFSVAFSAVLLVLLVACANVGNLLLARTAARGREMAVRMAIGAGRRRVVRQLLTESLVLSVTASVLGLWVARVVPGLVFNTAFGSLDTQSAVVVGPDWRVVIFGLLLATLTCLAFGLAPALEASRTGLLPELNGRGTAFGRTRLRSWLLGVQVAASVILLITSSLLARGLQHAYQVDRGFRSQGVSMLSFELPASTPIAHRQAFEAEIIAAARPLADRGLAAIATLSPFGDWINYVRVGVDDSARPDWISLTEVSPGYFALLRIPLTSGRALSAADAGQHRIVVNEAFARRVMRGQNPIGKVVSAAGEDSPRSAVGHQIVGVVSTVDHGEGAEPAAYEILAGRSEWLWAGDSDRLHPPRLLFRTGDSAVMTRLLNAAKHVEPRVRVIDAPLSASIEARFSDDWLSVWMAGSVGVLALLLATLGVGGAFGYAVRQQKRQIAVRLALGARTRDVIAAVLGNGARPLGIGLVAGFAGAFICGQLFRESLFGLDPLDPISYVYVVIVIAGAALAALAIPTWRAARVDPVSVLRTD